MGPVEVVPNRGGRAWTVAAFVDDVFPAHPLLYSNGHPPGPAHRFPAPALDVLTLLAVQPDVLRQVGIVFGAAIVKFSVQWPGLNCESQLFRQLLCGELFDLLFVCHRISISSFRMFPAPLGVRLLLPRRSALPKGSDGVFLHPHIETHVSLKPLLVLLGELLS